MRTRRARLRSRDGPSVNAQRQDRFSGVKGQRAKVRRRPQHYPDLVPAVTPLITGLVRCVEKLWREPDEGIWEIRGPRRHFVHSKIMVWAALDRAVRFTEASHMDGPLEQTNTANSRNTSTMRAAQPTVIAWPDKSADRRRTAPERHRTA